MWDCMLSPGQTFTLPLRKAAPLPQSPSTEHSPQASQHRSTELHSRLSPLSPGSPIYPDGVFTPLWLAKHQQHVPSLLIAFFNVSADESTSQNEQIQIDINAIRNALGRSGYKTRFAAVLMSDKSILHAPELEDRLSAIRRATTLDPKSGLFFMPPMSSQAEIATFVQSMLTPLQPLVVEYYRDLTKHARRKKIRGGPSPSVTSPVDGGSHSLSTPGWNVRYEVKQGVFAELRQEMDVAERHYAAAIEELFNSEGILEATPSWSPRWNEARMLCDILALRVLRCQLWTGHSTSAAIAWVNYKVSTRDLVDRRGKGSQTYSWDAWESRWAEVMAQLIQHAALPSLQGLSKHGPDESGEMARLQVYALPEKALTTVERLPPFHLLHHPGYWLRLAFQSARARRTRTLAIPEEDRVPPGQSPASAVAQRSKNYDAYLVPEPHEEYPLPGNKGHDHIAALGTLATKAVREFSSRGQTRAAECIRYDLAHQVADAGRYDEALEILMPIWEEASWRDDDWNDLLRPLLVLLHDCATHVGNAEVHLATAWELLGATCLETPVRESELADYVARSKVASGKIAVRFENRQRLCPVSVSFAFSDKETHVGEPVECQLILTSHIRGDSAPLTISFVGVALSSSKIVTIKHKPDSDRVTGAETLADLSGTTESDDGSLTMDADMALRSSQKRIYSFFLTFREAGIVRMRQAALRMDNESFSLEHVFTEESLVGSTSVYVTHDDVLEQRRLPHADTTAVIVLPKPPKMQVMLHGLRKQYYTNERIHLDVELVNEEAEKVDGRAAARSAGQAHEAVTVQWDGQEAGRSHLAIGSLGVQASHKAALSIAAPSEPSTLVIEVEVTYTLESDQSTPLTKSLTVEIIVATPFEAKYNFGPLLHSDPWPSYFNAGASSTEGEPEGITHQWRMGGNVHSTATDALVIHGMKLVVDNVAHDASCSLLETATSEKQTVAPGQSTQASFEFLTRKASLDDRRPTNVDLFLDIKWSREKDSETVTTSLPVPRLTLPSSEPRVLCTVFSGPVHEDELVLQYHLENPSTHFLTFALTMEANDEFAFSGPKYRTLSLAPLSRLRVEYRILLHDQEKTEAPAEQGEGCWIWPVLQVVDSYYQKNLRVHSGGPRVKVDEKRGLGVLVNEKEAGL